MTVKRTILQPSYVKEFNCIGSECEDTCCIGWRVSLDRKTYFEYRNMNNSELKPIIEKNVGRDRSQNNDSAYGKINMDSDGRCPFLDEDNLCKVYIHAGEDKLSATCRFYPRTVNRIDGRLERSLTMSCPEVARLALLNPNGIDFEHVEEDFDKRNVINSIFDTEGHLFLNKPQRYFWDIRIFSLSLLQNRNYNLGERLIILGIVYKNIEDLYAKNKMEELLMMLNNMNVNIDEGVFKEELDKVPTNNQIQMLLAKAMTDKKVTQGVSSSRYLEYLKETLLGIGQIEGVETEEVLKKYEENLEEFYKPYIEEKEYILENFLVNEYFREMMPFGSYKSMWDSYIFLCSLYSMTKLHLIGMAGYHEGLDDELTLKLIQSLSKVMLHNTQYIHQIVNLLKVNEYDSLAYMAILVKN